MPGRKINKGNAGLGRAIAKDKNRQYAQSSALHQSHVTGLHKNVNSVLDQTSLDDFLTRADMANQEFEAERSTHIIFESNSVIKDFKETLKPTVDLATMLVPIPKRPEWDKNTSPEELTLRENTEFLAWRSGLSSVEEETNAIMTPYERNLDFWRQLWRVVERSDVLIQILDGRNPLFYQCPDLEAYVKKHNKRSILLMNKADFLTEELRQRWFAYYEARGIEVIFFSALRELTQQDAAEKPDQEENIVVPHGSLDIADQFVLNAEDLLNRLQGYLPEVNGQYIGVIGMVGYPNVGKSSVINALIGAKKVSVSRTPGKTKHFQTLSVPGYPNITLCDCPGLVFPSVVATREDLVISGVVPLCHMREFLPSVQRVVQKVGYRRCLIEYGCVRKEMEIPKVRGMKDPCAEARAFLSAFAFARGYMLRLNVPDLSRGCKRVLEDYCTGAFLYCEPPPDGQGNDPIYRFEAIVEEDSESDSDESCAGGNMPKYLPMTAGDSARADVLDLDDLDIDLNFQNMLLDHELQAQNQAKMEGRMTKRKARSVMKASTNNKMGVSTGGNIMGTRKVRGRKPHNAEEVDYN